MRLKKSFQLAFNIFVHSKLRSWLTIIGIIVGIAAVVSIISMSLGAQQQLQQRLGGLGADVLTVSPGAAQRAFGAGFGGGDRGGGGGTSAITNQKNLTSSDVSAIMGIENIKYVMGSVSGRANVTYSAKTANNLNVNGINVNVWKYITTEQLSSGRLLGEGDSNSIVIGGSLADNSTFGKSIPINTKIDVGGKTFNVVGITTEGRTIYMPITQAKDVLGITGNAFSSISVTVSYTHLTLPTIYSV